MTDVSDSKTSTSLSFVLDKELFALDITRVREILDFAEITRIPQAPEYMRGVVNLRGNAIPVMDMRLKFGMGRTEQTIHSRIVILEVPIQGEMTVVGVMADAVKEVFELDREQIKPPPTMGTSVNTELIKGIGRYRDQFILILDADKVFSGEELAAVAGRTGQECPDGQDDCNPGEEALNS